MKVNPIELIIFVLAKVSQKLNKNTHKTEVAKILELHP